jgi:hypothetical protein
MLRYHTRWYLILMNEIKLRPSIWKQGPIIQDYRCLLHKVS